MKYWEPHTSSIDFCETDYLHNDYIVEMHNTWSSLIGISLFGILGLIYCNPTNEFRFTLVHLVLIMIGIGSSGLHGTLHWIFQSSDELPMLYFLLAALYCMLEIDGPSSKQKPHDTKSFKNKNEFSFPLLSFILLLVAGLQTIIYYIFQESYIVFVSTFSISVLLMTIFDYSLIFRRTYTDNSGKQWLPKDRVHAKGIFFHGMSIFFFLGVIPWKFEMDNCEIVLRLADQLPGIFRGMTPHVLWHFAAGLAGYCVTARMSCCRLEVLGKRYTVEYVFGALPIIHLLQKPE